MTDRIPDILDKSLAAALSGDGPSEAFRSHPEEAPELAPLIDVALAGREALAVEISDGQATALRERVLADARRQLENAPALSPLQRVLQATSRPLVRPAAIAGLVLALSGGTALAANAAGPDSRLYPVKQELESMRTALAAQLLDKAAVEVGNAGKRIDEADAMVAKGRLDLIPGLLARYDTSMSQAETLVAQASSQGQDTGQIMVMMNITQARHDQLVALLASEQGPASIAPATGQPPAPAGEASPPADSPGDEHESDQAGSNNGRGDGSGDGSGGNHQGQNDHPPESGGFGQDQDGGHSSQDGGHHDGSGQDKQDDSSNSHVQGNRR